MMNFKKMEHNIFSYFGSDSTIAYVNVIDNIDNETINIINYNIIVHQAGYTRFIKH